MRIVGSIQARMGSTRLPGKVLKEIAGKPMLLWHVERLRRARLLDEIVVATTVNPADDAIAALCGRHGIALYRGSEDDVLGRVAGLIRERKADIHAEFFGDSPLTDPHLVDEVIGYYLKRRDCVDYASNSVKTTYPPGQEVIVYRGSALVEADAAASKDDPLREHCGLHIVRDPSRFRVAGLEAPAHYRFPELYLEVDTAEDFEVVSAVVRHFAERGQPHFSLAQILDFFHEHEELAAANRNIPRRWKAFRQDGP